MSVYDKDYYDRHKEKIKAYQQKNKEKRREYCKSEKFKESVKKYRLTEKGRANSIASNLRYAQSDKGKKKARLYGKSEKGKLSRSEACKKWRESEKGKEKLDEYHQSDKYKNYWVKYRKTEKHRFVKSQYCAQRRNLGFVLITDDIPNEEFAYHHINHNLVAPIPKDLHQMYNYHNDDDLVRHKFFCYQIIKQLYRKNT